MLTSEVDRTFSAKASLNLYNACHKDFGLLSHISFGKPGLEVVGLPLKIAQYCGAEVSCSSRITSACDFFAADLATDTMTVISTLTSTDLMGKVSS
jgi:hypothetical protein